jgi:hypothetical protein
VLLGDALLRLQRGDFNASEQVAAVLLANDAEDVWIAGGHLLAHAVPRARLLDIGRRLLDAEKVEGDAMAFTRAFVCRIWARAMILATVPAMIAIFRQTSTVDARRRILLELADMFEPTPGDLYERIEVGSEEFDEQGYLRTLEDRWAKARQTAAAAGNRLYYRGAPFCFPEYAHNLLKRIARNDPRDNFDCDRMIFEANSGVPCREFYSPAMQFQPLAAAAIVEQFLDSDAPARYQPGVRYFFGNRIDY